MPLAVDGMKICANCAEDKPVSEYYRNKRASDGYQAYCKECQASPEAYEERRKMPKRKGRRQGPVASTGDAWYDLALTVALRAVDDTKGLDISASVWGDFLTKKEIAEMTKHECKEKVKGIIMRNAERWLRSTEGQEFLDGLPCLDISVTGGFVADRAVAQRRKK